MDYVFSKRQQTILERVAPWADLSLLREKIIEYLKEHSACEDSDIDHFLSCKRPCLPDRLYFANIIAIVVNNAYGSDDFITMDPLFSVAHLQIRNYFLNEDLWQRV